MNTAGDDHRLRRLFGFVLVGDLTVTLGLVYATLQAMSAVDRVINDSDAARSQAQLLFVGTGLLGLAVTAVLITLGRRSSRRSLVALIGLGAALAASAVLLALLLPMPGPTRPVGSKPLALLALALGLLAWSTALITHRWRAADPTLPSAGARSVSRAGLPRRWRALAALVALLVAVGAGGGTWALRTTYRAAADEYLRAGRLTPLQPSVRSVLDGTIAWTAAGTLPENGRFDGLTADSFGLPVTVGSDVLSVDRTSGAERWRYFRSDLDDYSPDPITTADGRRVLVDWTSENAGYLVLDGESGERISTLPSRYADDDLSAVLSDGVLVSHQQGRGSDSIVAVDFDGSERWRFAPGTCKDLIARATGSVAVVTVHDSCDEPRDQTVGLDLATGRQLWAITDPPRTVATTADVVLVSDAGRDT